jgi:adenylate cyclase
MSSTAILNSAPASGAAKKGLRPKARAILFTDIVGSTRYFASRGDQAGLEMLERHNQALFPIVEQSNGHIVKTIGDSIFAIFEEPLDALRAGFAMQQKLSEMRNCPSEGDCPHIRVGLHYGLVTLKDNDVFGDAVNLAERVKSSAEGDQICVSRTLKDMVRANPHFVLQSIGLRELKGATEPMELFQLVAAPSLPATSRWQTWVRRRQRALAANLLKIAACVAIAALLGAAAFWKIHPGFHPSERAIAVLPFRGLPPTPADEYLSLSLPDQLDTQLGKTLGHTLLIKPLESVQHYQSASWKIRDVAQELDVGTIVVGSYAGNGEKLRVRVGVVDTAQDRQVWSDEFQSSRNNSLQLVEKLAPAVIGAVRSRIAATDAQSGRPDEAIPAAPQSVELGTQNRDAYELYLRGIALERTVSRDNISAAMDLLQQSVALDKNFAGADAALAEVYVTDFWWNFSNDKAWLARAEESARRAVAEQPELAEAHFALAYALEGQGRRMESVRENLASIKADAEYVPALTNLARYLFYMGDYDRALTVLDRIALLDPVQNVHVRKAIYLYFAGRLPESRSENRKAEQRAVGVDELTLIGITYAWLGDLGSAEETAQKLEKLHADAPSVAEVGAWIDTARGKYEDARAKMGKFPDGPRWGVAQEKAALYAAQGDRQNALTWVSRAVDLGAPNYAWLNSNRFRVLRGDPKYDKALADLAAEFRLLRPELEAAASQVRE